MITIGIHNKTDQTHSIQWYTDGKISKFEEYFNGMHHGNFKSWHPNGQIYMHLKYEKGYVVEVICICNMDGESLIIPETGDVVVYKACKVGNIAVYVTLTIPDGAKRTPYIWHSNKYRAEYVRVERIQDRQGNEYTECSSFV